MNCYPFKQNKKLCSGCGACTQACSHKALTMQPDKEGFLYPILDEEKCIQCGLCDVICPMISESHQENMNPEGFAYLVTTKDRNLTLNSATVGLCTYLSKDCIQDNGVSFGVVLNESEWKANHVCADSASMIEKMRNSKYLQSETRNTYSEVKSLLNDKKNVLYIGTPCQIAGLKAFLRKPYETLLTIDIVCHGVFSSKLVALEVEYWENLFNGKLSNLRFRSKRFFPWFMGGVVNFDITDSKGKTVHVERHAKSSPTYRCFAYSGDGYSYNIRPSCYSCPFRGKGRYCDLTVGDAWGLNKKYPQLFTSYNMRNGVSILICNTMKGVNVGNKIESFYDLYAIPVESVFVQPALLPTNRNIPAKRKAIYANDNIPYGQLVEKLFNVNLEHENKMTQWQLTKMQIKSAIKRILLLR